MLSAEGAETRGTSIWFVGATGLPSTADEFVWS